MLDRQPNDQFAQIHVHVLQHCSGVSLNLVRQLGKPFIGNCVLTGCFQRFGSRKLVAVLAPLCWCVNVFMLFECLLNEFVHSCFIFVGDFQIIHMQQCCKLFVIIIPFKFFILGLKTLATWSTTPTYLPLQQHQWLRQWQHNWLHSPCRARHFILSHPKPLLTTIYNSAALDCKSLYLSQI